MFKIRKILFPIFVLIYFIYCPLLILRAMGIIVTPKSSKGLTHTGLIALDTIPSGAQVKFDGKPWEEKTPTVIRTLREGHYSVTVTSNGYRAWSQELAVQPAKATSIENIILIPDPWVFDKVSTTKYKELIVTEADSYLLLRQNDLLTGLDFYRWPAGLEEALATSSGKPDSTKTTSLLTTDSPLASAEILSLHTMPLCPFILGHIQLAGMEKFLWIDPRDEKIKITDISDLISPKNLEIRWNAQKPNDLLVREGHDLNRINIEERAIFPKICRNLRGFGLVNKHIYGLTNTEVQVMDYEGKTQETLPNPANIIAELNRSKTFYRIYLFNDSTIVYFGENGQLMLNKPPYLINDKGTLDLFYNNKTHQLIFWDNNRIGILDFSENTDESFPSASVLTWPVTKAHKIEQVLSVNNGTHLLYRDQNTVYLLDLNPHLPAQPQELFKVKRNTAIQYFDKTGKIFFLDEKSEDILSATLHPVHAGANKKNDKDKKEDPS